MDRHADASLLVSMTVMMDFGMALASSFGSTATSAARRYIIGEFFEKSSLIPVVMASQIQADRAAVYQHARCRKARQAHKVKTLNAGKVP